MALVKTITKHGNSAGIILDQTLLKVLGWEVGTEVEIQVKKDAIVLTHYKKAEPASSSAEPATEK